MLGSELALSWAVRSRLRDGKRQEPAAVHGGCATDGLGGFVWLALLLQFRHAGEMEKKLLGIAAIGTEMRGGKFLNASGGDIAFFGEIELAQHAFDPDIDGEGGEAFAGKEQHTVGDFFSDAMEPHERGACGIIGLLG